MQSCRAQLARWLVCVQACPHSPRPAQATPFPRSNLTICTVHFTLHTPLYTLHGTRYTPHSALDTLHTTFYTLHFTHYTLHSTFHTLHHFTRYILHSTLYTLHFTLYTPYLTLYSLHASPTTRHQHPSATFTPRAPLLSLTPTSSPQQRPLFPPISSSAAPATHLLPPAIKPRPNERAPATRFYTLHSTLTLPAPELQSVPCIFSFRSLFH